MPCHRHYPSLCRLVPVVVSHPFLCNYASSIMKDKLIILSAPNRNAPNFPPNFPFPPPQLPDGQTLPPPGNLPFPPPFAINNAGSPPQGLPFPPPGGLPPPGSLPPNLHFPSNPSPMAPGRQPPSGDLPGGPMASLGAPPGGLPGGPPGGPPGGGPPGQS